MKFKKSDIYVGNIKKMTNEFITEDLKVFGKIEYNGEKELFVKLNDCYIPVREIKGFIQYLIVQKFSQTRATDSNVLKKWANMPYKYIKIMLIDDSYSVFPHVLGEIIKMHNGRYIADVEPLFINPNGKISLEELQDLRLKHKYTPKGISYEERLTL